MRATTETMLPRGTIVRLTVRLPMPGRLASEAVSVVTMGPMTVGQVRDQVVADLLAAMTQKGAG